MQKKVSEIEKMYEMLLMKKKLQSNITDIFNLLYFFVLNLHSIKMKFYFTLF